MNIVTFDQVLTSLKSLMDKVCTDHSPTVITRDDGEPVVMISLRDFNSMEETLHLLDSPKNAARLMESIAQLKQGKAQTRELIRNEEQEGGKQTASQDDRSLMDR